MAEEQTKTDTTNPCPTFPFLIAVLRLLDAGKPGRSVTGSGDAMEQIRRRLGEIEAIFATMPSAEVEAKP